MAGLVVITTVGTEEQANEIARELIVRRHAACVNLVPGLRSLYRWQGKICRDSEFMLIVKTTEEEYPAVEAAIKELHSYEVPEILAFKVHRGEPRFLDWIGASLDKSATFSDDQDEGVTIPLDDTNF